MSNVAVSRAAIGPVFREPVTPEADILRAIGLDQEARAAGLPIQEISCGVPFIYVPLSSRAVVDTAEPDLATLRALRSAFPDGHNAVFWTGMVSLQGVKMLRPSRIHMRITALAPQAVTRVQVGGQAVRVGTGTIDIS